MKPVFAEPEEVADYIRSSTKVSGKDYVIIDVRGDDYKDGHIPGAINVPSTEIQDRANELIQEYSNVPEIYFHCALSQVRGPKSARIYSEALNDSGKESEQKVKILKNGFEGWQTKYKDLIEKS